MMERNIDLANRQGERFGSFRYDPERRRNYATQVKKACANFDATAVYDLPNIVLYDDGSTDEAGAEILKTAERAIFTWFDTVLGYEDAGKHIFEGIRPYASVGGEFVCRTILLSVTKTVIGRRIPIDIFREIKQMFNKGVKHK